ncbi:DoxX family protein [Polaromonas sp. P1-6]|nr:DoxX family protein [Polaromonas sp. P1-6]
MSGLGKIWRFAAVAGFMASKGLPAAELMLIATIALEVAGGLALIAGWRVRYAAWGLLVFTGLAAVIFHAFWAAEAPAFQNQLNHFLKNVAIMGGLLCIAAAGAGGGVLTGGCAGKASQTPEGVSNETRYLQRRLTRWPTGGRLARPDDGP